MVGLMRPRNFLQLSVFDATRRGNTYENLRVRSLKYKSMAKEKRKAARRMAIGGVKSPKDTNEELPPFFLQPRYKLLYKVL